MVSLTGRDRRYFGGVTYVVRHAFLRTHCSMSEAGNHAVLRGREAEKDGSAGGNFFDVHIQVSLTGLNLMVQAVTATVLRSETMSVILLLDLRDGSILHGWQQPECADNAVIFKWPGRIFEPGPADGSTRGVCSHCPAD